MNLKTRQDWDNLWNPKKQKYMVVTRGNYVFKIFTLHAKSKIGVGSFPIIGEVMLPTGRWLEMRWSIDGYPSSMLTDKLPLYMDTISLELIPEPGAEFEPVYRTMRKYTNVFKKDGMFHRGYVYNSYSVAKDMISNDPHYVATAIIEWIEKIK